MVAAGAIAGIVIGSIIIVAACGGIMYYYKEYIVSSFATNTRQEMTRVQRQVSVDETVPPDYIDHALDPVCVYEHELPPDVVAPVQPILVHTTSSEHIISPEEDPLFVSSHSLPRDGSYIAIPAITTSFSADMEEINTVSNLNVDESERQGASDSLSQRSITPNLPTPGSSVTSITASSLRTPSLSSYSPLSIASSPRFVDQNMLNMARLTSPPSYEVQNRVVSRSPLGNPRSHHHQHSRSTSDTHQFMLSPATIQRPPQEDYFSQVRTRSHTFSHPEPFQPHVAAAQQTQGELPSTPRYSLEFPSNVPHERHLEEHQRARSQYPMWESSIYREDGDEQGNNEQSIDMPFAQVYTPPRQSSGLFTPNTTDAVFGSGSPSGSSNRQRRAGPVGARPRATTIGESSKLLIQKMQSLWKKTPEIGGGGFSPRLVNSSTPNLHQQQQEEMGESGIIGLGIQQYHDHGHETVQHVEEGEAEVENSDSVAIVVEPEDDGNGSSSSSIESSLTSSSEHQEEQVHEQSFSSTSLHLARISMTRVPPSEVMDLSIPTISVPLAAS
ncbi:hypothetical protein BGZ46_010087 [Entomortierella lignicola]|nr:hypothetical protein BGZ46_010087 [Entomortierella lignicola]